MISQAPSPVPFGSAHLHYWIPQPRFPEGDAPYKHRGLALVAVSMGVFVAALDMSIVGIVGPALSKDLGATASEIQWAFDAFSVVMAGFVVLGGGLAERFGRKGFAQLGMLVFALGATVCAYAPNPGILIVGRVVSGLGAAVVFPTCLSIISALFPAEERPRAVAIFASISASGLTSGPLLGGILIKWFWWGAAFLIITPVALLSIAAIAVIVPPSRNPKEGPLDMYGALLSVIGLGGIVFGVIEGPNRGWGEAVVLVPFCTGILVTVAFIIWELRCRVPLFDLRVFKDSRVVGGALAMALVYFTLQGNQLLIPQYLGYVLNLSSVQIGLMMCPFGLALVLLSPLSSPLVEKHGQRTMLLVSLGFMAAGQMVLAILHTRGGLVNVLTGICIYGIGYSLIVAPATSVIMVAIPKEKAGDGSAVNMVSRQIGGAMGVAILGSLASMVYRGGLTLRGYPLTEAQQQSVERSLSGVIALNEQLEAATATRLDAMADASMVKGVAVAMAVSGAVSAVVALVAFFSLRDRAEPS